MVVDLYYLARRFPELVRDPVRCGSVKDDAKAVGICRGVRLHVFLTEKGGVFRIVRIDYEHLLFGVCEAQYARQSQR